MVTLNRLTLTFITSVLLMATGMHLQAQSRLNFGLRQPQEASDLPKGNAPFDQPTLKKKENIRGEAIALGNSTYLLNTGWELAAGAKALASEYSPVSAKYKTTDWYNATVPGTVLTTLVDRGVYPDPYIGLNNMAIPDTLCRQDWWYRLSFDSPGKEKGRMAWLQFEGINYRAQIWLNGQLLGTMEGAFRRGRFNVTKHLKESGQNILAVQILPPPNPGIPHEESAVAGMGPNGGQLALDGPTFISSEGWDWIPGIRDRNIGIWQDVKLHYTRSVSLHDPQVITDLPLPDTSSAKITVKATIQNHSSKPQKVLVKGLLEGKMFSLEQQLKPNESREVIFSPEDHASLIMREPKLWWPNGYGNPALYNMKLQLIIEANQVSDEKNIRFGVREFSYELMADAPAQKALRFVYNPTDMEPKVPLLDNFNRRKFKEGIFIPTLRKEIDVAQLEKLPDSTNPYLVIRVNGVRVFCKGGNWGMDDGMKRVSRERLEPAFRLHKEAHYNMVRNWTGESTEEVFYELADEYGMLVWNDFWLSTEGYNLPPNDQQLLLSNSLDVIKRFRNHPSIVLWCPRNEGYAPVEMEDDFARQVAEEDGTRLYIGNSREINLRQSGSWHYVENPLEYFTDHGQGFTTEIGTISVPVASTIRKFIKPQDHWPINDVWHYHDLHSDKQKLEDYLGAVDSLYGKATGLDDFSKKVQLINYDSHRAIFEAWNSRLWDDASGVLLWMTHPAWPSMIWQTYSWDFETHGSYYGAKKACEPLHIQMNLHDQKVVAINTSPESYANAKVLLNVYDLEGREIYARSHEMDIVKNDKTEAFTAELPTSGMPEVYLLRLQLKNSEGEVLSQNSYWKTSPGTTDFTAFNQLETVDLSGKLISKEKESLVFVVENKSETPVIGVKLNLLDAEGNILLPAYFSHGYFNLLPGEQQQIKVSFPEGTMVSKIKTEGYNNRTSIIDLELSK